MMHIHIQHTYICSIYMHSLSGLQLSTRGRPFPAGVPGAGVQFRYQLFRSAGSVVLCWKIKSWKTIWKTPIGQRFGRKERSQVGFMRYGKLIPSEPGVRCSSRCEALAIQLGTTGCHSCLEGAQHVAV